MKGKVYLWPSDYMADPSVHVWNDRLYIYPSHDWDAGVGDDDSGAEYEMKDYHVFSTEATDRSWLHPETGGYSVGKPPVVGQ